MNQGCQNDPRSRSMAMFLPPPAVEETAWDILLALHSDRSCELRIDKLARLASISQPVLRHWLMLLEERQLITGSRHPNTGEIRAMLTRAGRGLLDRYFSATNDLQVVAAH